MGMRVGTGRVREESRVVLGYRRSFLLGLRLREVVWAQRGPGRVLEAEFMASWPTGCWGSCHSRWQDLEGEVKPKERDRLPLLEVDQDWDWVWRQKEVRCVCYLPVQVLAEVGDRLQIGALATPRGQELDLRGLVVQGVAVVDLGEVRQGMCRTMRR